MAKKKKAKARKKVRKTLSGPLGGRGSVLGALHRGIPKGGLMDPSLRTDIGNVPGLSPVN